jgi:putative tricarboxylic transport membrane protein
MQNNDNKADSRTLVSTRTMEIVVALLFMAAGAVVMTDSLRIGAGWVDPDGPQAGYFPMRMGAIMALSSAVVLVHAVLARGPGKPFVDRHALKQVLLVLIPAMVFIGAVNYIGVYVSAAVYIAAFMIFMGRYNWLTAGGIGLAVVVVLFFMFEVWFLVPLPKGPVEELFGY